MSKNNVPFRFDYVGSFLRPDYLKKAERIRIQGYNRR